MKTDECPTTPDYYVDVTVERTACKKHQARKGESCWLYLSAVTNTYVRAVCNQRARAAGNHDHCRVGSSEKTYGFRRVYGSAITAA